MTISKSDDNFETVLPVAVAQGAREERERSAFTQRWQKAGSGKDDDDEFSSLLTKEELQALDAFARNESQTSLSLSSASAAAASAGATQEKRKPSASDVAGLVTLYDALRRFDRGILRVALQRGAAAAMAEQALYDSVEKLRQALAASPAPATLPFNSFNSSNNDASTVSAAVANAREARDVSLRSLEQAVAALNAHVSAHLGAPSVAGDCSALMDAAEISLRSLLNRDPESLNSTPPFDDIPGCAKLAFDSAKVAARAAAAAPHQASAHSEATKFFNMAIVNLLYAVRNVANTIDIVRRATQRLVDVAAFCKSASPAAFDEAVNTFNKLGAEIAALSGQLAEEQARPWRLKQLKQEEQQAAAASATTIDSHRATEVEIESKRQQQSKLLADCVRASKTLLVERQKECELDARDFCKVSGLVDSAPLEWSLDAIQSEMHLIQSASAPATTAATNTAHNVYRVRRRGRGSDDGVQEFAVKQYDADERFFDTMRLMSRMRHAYIAPVVAAFTAATPKAEEEGAWFTPPFACGYLVMPFASGGMIRDWCDTNRDVFPFAVLRVVRQVFEAVQHLHENNIAHGNLGCANIVMSSTEIDGSPLLLGFAHATTSSSTTTATANDVCALAKLFVELRLGTDLSKHSNDDTLSIVEASATAVPTSQHDHTARLTSAEIELVKRMLASDPNQRPTVKECLKHEALTSLPRGTQSAIASWMSPDKSALVTSSGTVVVAGCIKVTGQSQMLADFLPDGVVPPSLTSSAAKDSSFTIGIIPRRINVDAHFDTGHRYTTVWRVVVVDSAAISSPTTTTSAAATAVAPSTALGAVGTALVAKVYPQAQGNFDSTFARQLKIEAQHMDTLTRAQTIANSHIARFHSCVYDAGQRHYVMFQECCDGETLHSKQLQRLRLGVPCEESQARVWIKQLLSALAFAHSKNIAHYDVKSDNIVILKSNNEVRLIDWGESRTFAIKSNNADNLRKIEESERGLSFSCSPQFTSPERLGEGSALSRGEQGTATPFAPDISSVGCVTLHLLCKSGQMPFVHYGDAVSVSAKLQRMLSAHNNTTTAAASGVAASAPASFLPLLDPFLPMPLRQQPQDAQLAMASATVFAEVDHISSDARDFIGLCLKLNPQERPSAAELLKHRWLA